MTITMTELALFVWAMVATMFWLQARHDRRTNMLMTIEILKRVAKGKVRVIETEDSFEIKEV